MQRGRRHGITQEGEKKIKMEGGRELKEKTMFSYARLVFPNIARGPEALYLSFSSPNSFGMIE